MMADPGVYISYCTEVEKTIASLIRCRLVKHGVRVIPGIQEGGDSLTPAIRSAISSASVWIVVFSKQYAESATCLNELLWMVDTKQTKIIPIFYDIKPSELRWVDEGGYARALQDHRKKGVTTEELDKWRAALSKISEISGVVFITAIHDHGECLKKIVDTVLDKVGGEELYEGRYPVGLDQRAENFRRDHVSNRGINVVGIVGSAGSGKSTLATRLYNNCSKRSQFERCCFLPDVSKKELTSLQKNLLRDLVLDRNSRIQDTRHGRSILQHRLQDLSGVLIVIDGIENQEQIDNLLFVKDIVGNDSLILVTSRDQSLLDSNGVQIYNVKLLDAKEAQELFCLHAFNKPQPVHGLEDVVEQSVRMCGGLPLELEVLAGQLRNERDPNKWKRHLETLRKQGPNEWWRGFWIDRMTGAFKAIIFAATVIGFDVYFGKFKWLRFKMRDSRWNDRMKAVFSSFISSIINALCWLKVKR